VTHSEKSSRENLALANLILCLQYHHYEGFSPPRELLQLFFVVQALKFPELTMPRQLACRLRLLSLHEALRRTETMEVTHGTGFSFMALGSSGQHSHLAMVVWIPDLIRAPGAQRRDESSFRFVCAVDLS
jgi:hypothetical protein